MKSNSKLKSPLITGTLILTITGFFNRGIGFFYRIFLSNTIGEEGMGIYQLVFPVLGIGMAMCALSFQTAISRYVAAANGTHQEGKQRFILRCGLFLTSILSCTLAFIVYQCSTPIARYLLLEERCDNLLKIAALSLPFSALHCCGCGYYYGKQKASIPAFSQVVEQVIRVLSVWIIWKVRTEKGLFLTPSGVMAGLLLSEIASDLFLFFCYLLTEHTEKYKTALIPIMKDLLSMAIPLTANRLLLNILQSVEAIMIPSRLQLFGLTNSSALSVYGVLTGMAMPFIFFPSTLTNSVAVMLLPAVSKAQSNDQTSTIHHATHFSIRFCLWLGILCTGIFLLFGNDMGNFIFHSELAGTYIKILGWLCPFLYLTTTLASILNGTGYTTVVFFQNMIAVTIRLAFVVFLIPRFGITAYLWGMLLSELLLALLHLSTLNHHSAISFSCFSSIFIPTIFTALSGIFALCMKHVLQLYLPHYMPFTLCLSIGIMFFCFCFLTTCLIRKKR
ncbi:MAG: oligosaccharide flippase family protein [Clostridiales bacterium]|nr:oligosaccharide flippase family protein [Clostridiales bacterium]